ncbi:DUF2851 family protein [Pseudozobellia sp. WGM2]|uniref:DUF2851 family protein n=1 Tax=Pseudozobellia sp. WGM2 TaxID=2787625 RepID=UPI001AE05862|nr:DUF2851 family protein [Pseudozobellia sp. WGM2]
MREDLLHFIWKYKKLAVENLFTAEGERVELLNVGTHNHLAGPDFFNARIKIDGQLWAGNVEIHLKSSDWFAHGHEKDPNYNNVILHVVWEHDIDIFCSNNVRLPCLELNKYIPKNILSGYESLFDKRNVSFINCEKTIAQTNVFSLKNWLERLYFERLEKKSEYVHDLLQESNNDWEQVLFKLLLRNFGSKINGQAFMTLGNALPFKTVRKMSSKAFRLESVFLGMSHLLTSNDIVDDYYIQLKNEYIHQRLKYSLDSQGVLKPDFFKLRPANFPTVRLSQLANLYAMHDSLFEKIIAASTIDKLYDIFEVNASTYWSNHFTFGKVSKNSMKRLTKKFVDLLIINTILPLKFCHARAIGKDVNDSIIEIIKKLSPELNSIISNFKRQGVSVSNSMDSQSLLQLYNLYCSKNRCLQCRIGASLLE